MLTALYCDTWLIDPVMHRTLTEIATAHASGGAAEDAQHVKAASMPSNPPSREYAVQDGVAVIPVEGIIGRKMSDTLQSSGVVSIDILDRLIQEADASDKVKGIVLAFDSPGGNAMGVPEVADTIKATQKPVIAYADGRLASGAYWLASQADAIYATRSASVGSIGAYMAVLDRTRQAEMEGVKIDVIKSGTHKGMGLPGTALTEEQRDMLQSSVDATGAEFRATVRAGRGRAIADEVMQGQSFSVADALAHGLIDGVTTIGQAILDAARLSNVRGRK